MYGFGINTPYMYNNYGFGNGFGCGCGYSFNNFLSCSIGNLFQTSNYMLGNSIGNLAGGVINGGVNLVGTLIFGGINKLANRIHINSYEYQNTTGESYDEKISAKLEKLGEDATENNYKTKYGTTGRAEELNSANNKITTATQAKKDADTNLDKENKTLKGLTSELETLNSQLAQAKQAATADNPNTDTITKLEADIKLKKDAIEAQKQVVTDAKAKQTERENELKAAEKEKTDLEAKIKAENNIITEIAELIESRNEAAEACISRSAGSTEKRDQEMNAKLTPTKTGEVVTEYTVKDGEEVTPQDLRAALHEFTNAKNDGERTNAQKKAKAIYSKISNKVSGNLLSSYNLVISWKPNGTCDDTKDDVFKFGL